MNEMYLTNKNRHVILINNGKSVTKVHSDCRGAISVNTSWFSVKVFDTNLTVCQFCYSLKAVTAVLVTTVWPKQACY